MSKTTQETDAKLSSQLFGQNTFLSYFSYEQLSDIDIDLEVERDADLNRIENLRKYIINSILNKKIAMFSPMVVSIRYEIDDETFAILDGQHRLKALTTIFETDLKLTDKQKLLISGVLNEFRYPVMIIDCSNNKSGSDVIEVERQIFSDLNFFAKKASRSLAITFNSRDDVPQLVHELVKTLKMGDLIDSGINRKKQDEIKTKDETKIEPVIKISTLFDAINMLNYNKVTKTKRAKEINPKKPTQFNFLAKDWLKLIRDHAINKEVRWDFFNKSSTILAIARFSHDLIEKYPEWKEILTRTLTNAKLELNSNINVLSDYDFSVDDKGRVSSNGTGSAISDTIKFLNHHTES